MKKVVLLMDDKLELLKVYSLLLADAGYQVLKASTREQAKDLIKCKRIHLGIFDIRMVDENDERDISGLLFAQREEYRALPKIILTAHPHYEYVRQALGPGPDGQPPAINFLYKKEGPTALVQAVDQAFQFHVHINWDLIIQFKTSSQMSFTNLVTIIDPSIEGEQLLEFAGEFEDLFRRLFYEVDEIRIQRLLWERDQHMAFEVISFTKDKPPELVVVTCGAISIVANEAQRYRDFAPRVPSRTSTVLVQSCQTIHFAANLYALARPEFDEVTSLLDIYRAGPEKLFHAILNSLFEATLSDWHQGKRMLEEDKTLDDIYRDKLKIKASDVGFAALQQRAQLIARQLSTIGEGLKFHDGNLVIKFGREVFSYPDPIPLLHRMTHTDSPVLLINTPGSLSGENILTDTSGLTWLTDFTNAGLAPLLWNFVMIESAIRFDWTESNKLQWLHTMEERLIMDDFTRFDTGDIEQHLRKPVRAIQLIRRVASRTSDICQMSYHLGIFFHAAKRLADFNPELRLMPDEIIRLGHLLIATAMISKKLLDGKQDRSGEKGIYIDKTNRIVWVDGIQLTLRGNSYGLLCKLYDHSNQLCTRRELIEEVFHERFDELDDSQINRLNTAIHRLREKIEEDSERPRYLLTEPGGGYRLAPKPHKQ